MAERIALTRASFRSISLGQKEKQLEVRNVIYLSFNRQNGRMQTKYKQAAHVTTMNRNNSGDQHIVSYVETLYNLQRKR